MFTDYDNVCDRADVYLTDCLEIAIQGNVVSINRLSSNQTKKTTETFWTLLAHLDTLWPW